MPQFTHLPPSDATQSGLRLLRTPPSHPIAGYVLSENLTGCKTHFTGHRTVPCEAPDCDACINGIPWRWHGYLAVLLENTQETIIFETTAKAASAFAAYYQRYATTRGCHFKASRQNGRANGRVIIQTRPADLAKITLPKPPPVQKLLCHIWNIPETTATLAPQRPRPPFADIKIKPENTLPEIKPLRSVATLTAAASPGRNGD